MGTAPKGLGKGLEALFAQSGAYEGHQDKLQLQMLHIDSLQPNPSQPRKTFAQESLQELAQSITNQGLLQPILACRQPGDALYRIVAGERRWRACKLADLQQIPVIVADLDPGQSMLLGLIENLQREDLNAIEAAQAMGLVQTSLGLSQAELAQKLGKSRPAVANTLRLLQLDTEIQEAVRQGDFSPGQARALLAVQDKEQRLELFQISLQRQLSARKIEQAAAFCKHKGHLPEELAVQENEAVQTKLAEQDPGFEQYKKMLQKTFSKMYPARVRINGAMHKGRISFQYTSRQELADLLQVLGMPEELISRETNSR